MAILMAVTGGFYFLLLYRRDKRRQEEREVVDRDRSFIRDRELEEQRIRQEHELQKEREESQYRQQKLNDQLINQFKKGVEKELSGLSSGGFIILDLPDNLRSMFHDLLKGFEDFDSDLIPF